MPSPAIALLLTGHELMTGDTVDTNSAMISRHLLETGILVAEKCTVGDEPDALKKSLLRLSQEYDGVIVNGGLGPTEDDLTASIIADLCGAPLVENAEALAHVDAWCERRGIQANSANLKQAWLPGNADLIPNPIGSAVGFSLSLGNCLVLTTPGVPSELEAMLPTVTTMLVTAVGGSETYIQRIQTFGVGESTIQQWANELGDGWPSSVTLGFRAGLPQLELKLTVATAEQVPDQKRAYELLASRFGDHILGEKDARLAQVVQALLRDQKKMMTTAESCTGGLIASMVTREPGSSAVFEAGLVTYANSAKNQLLGVGEKVLNTEGAVSEPVVRQMLLGALERAGADIGVAVSGIAGPDGGTADKPVGTVWIAWGTREDLRTHRAQIPGSRSLFQGLVAAVALDLIRRHLLGLPALPHYFTRQAQ